MASFIPQPPTPEHIKMIAAEERIDTDVIDDFLYWLTISKSYRICEWDDRNDRYVPLPFDIKRWIAEYLDIDLEMIDQEKRQVLDWIRKVNKRRDHDTP